MNKLVDSEISEYLSNNKFTRLGKSNSWVRKISEVIQYVSFNTTRGGHIRVIVLVFPSDIDDDLVLGGNLTQSSIGGSDTIGGDYLWEKNESSVGGILKALQFVAFPWFNSFQSVGSFTAARSMHIESMSFAIPEEITSLNFSNIDTVKIDEKPCVRLSKKEYRMNFIPSIRKDLKKLGFRIVSSEEPVFFRKRGDLYDVLLIDLINYGVHFGAYAFNWVDQLAIDGAKEVNRDNSFILNGGVVTSKGISPGFEESFLIEDKDRFIRTVNENILPFFEDIKSTNDFISSIKPDMKTVADALLKDF